MCTSNNALSTISNTVNNKIYKLLRSIKRFSSLCRYALNDYQQRYLFECDTITNGTLRLSTLDLIFEN